MFRKKDSGLAKEKDKKSKTKGKEKAQEKEKEKEKEKKDVSDPVKTEESDSLKLMCSLCKNMIQIELLEEHAKTCMVDKQGRVSLAPNSAALEAVASLDDHVSPPSSPIASSGWTSVPPLSESPSGKRPSGVPALNLTGSSPIKPSEVRDDISLTPSSVGGLPKTGAETDRPALRRSETESLTRNHEIGGVANNADLKKELRILRLQIEREKTSRRKAEVRAQLMKDQMSTSQASLAPSDVAQEGTEAPAGSRVSVEETPDKTLQVSPAKPKSPDTVAQVASPVTGGGEEVHELKRRVEEGELHLAEEKRERKEVEERLLLAEETIRNLREEVDSQANLLIASTRTAGTEGAVDDAVVAEQKATVAQLQAEAGSLGKELERVNELLREKESTIGELGNQLLIEKEAHKAATIDKFAQSDAVLAKEAEMQTLRLKMSTLQDSIGDLQNQLNLERFKAAEVAHAKDAELSSLKMSLSTMQNELNSIQNVLDNERHAVKQAQMEKHRTAEALAAAENDISNLKVSKASVESALNDTANQLSAERDAHKSTTAEKYRLADLVHAKEAELSNTKLQLMTTKGNLESEGQANQRSQESIALYEERIRTLQANIESLQGTLNIENNEKFARKRAEEEREAQMQRLRMDLERTSESMSRLQAEVEEKVRIIQKFQGENQTLQQQVAYMHEDNATLQRQVQDSTVRIEQMGAAVKQCEDKISVLEQDGQSKQQQIQSLSYELSKERQVASELEKNLNITQQNLARTTQELDQYSSRANSLENELTRREDAIRHLENSNAELQRTASRGMGRGQSLSDVLSGAIADVGSYSPSPNDIQTLQRLLAYYQRQTGVSGGGGVNGGGNGYSNGMMKSSVRFADDDARRTPQAQPSYEQDQRFVSPRRQAPPQQAYYEAQTPATPPASPYSRGRTPDRSTSPYYRASDHSPFARTDGSMEPAARAPPPNRSHSPGPQSANKYDNVGSKTELNDMLTRLTTEKRELESEQLRLPKRGVGRRRQVEIDERLDEISKEITQMRRRIKQVG